MLDNTLRPAIAESASAELARRNLLDFGKLVYPEFQQPPHIKYIASLLEKLEQGSIRRLAIATSVRHGKSVIANQLYVPWLLGRNPRKNIILASHSEALAVMHSRISKNIVSDDRYPFDVQISSDSASVQRWNLTAGGGEYSIGTGGAVTGRGADFLIGDDILHDGLSETERDSAWRWYSEVAMPRLEPQGRVLVIGARFAFDDIFGRLLESEDAAAWTFISLPAICNSEDDPLGRAIGEALWPERMPIAELESRRREMSSYAFEAQFQQNPVPARGTLFQADWLAHRYTSLPSRSEPVDSRPQWARLSISLEPEIRPVCIQAIDSAWRDGLGNDYSVIATILADGKDYFVVDIFRKRLVYPDLIRAVYEEYNKHRPDIIYVEEAASGYALVQDLRRSTGLPITGVTPDRSKTARAEVVMPLFESGRVKFPVKASWLDDCISELLRYPAARHDDQLDAIVLAISKATATIARQQTAMSVGKLQGWMER